MSVKNAKIFMQKKKIGVKKAKILVQKMLGLQLNLWLVKNGVKRFRDIHFPNKQ